VGICGKGEPAQSLRARLERYMDAQGIGYKDAAFYSHMLPSLGSAGWKKNRVASDGWLAVGDAAGLVDPITGEGLYYAMRSADLASQVVLDEAQSPVGKARAYRELLRADFGEDLEFSATLAPSVYLGRFLFGAIPARLVQFAGRSPRFREVVQDLFAGTQPYIGLKRRLMGNLAGTLYEVASHLLLQRHPEYGVELS
jgi:flavin-dependent dehydrogenase